MSKKIQYMIAAGAVLAIIGGVLYQGLQTTVYYQTPGEVIAAPENFRNKTIRIGALVQPDSVTWNPDAVRLSFRVTEDSQASIPVVYDGVKPDMFKEGQGVVVEGRLGADGVFVAQEVLVKHSEEYRVEEAKKGQRDKTYQSLMK
ncbi:MAG: cytochrome c maturation protein CcmE [Deltaproteobacteria bacterium]|nr:cytochrome c maturation protein CcmE [Deltaproteobacteria bacterium]